MSRDLAGRVRRKTCGHGRPLAVHRAASGALRREPQTAPCAGDQQYRAGLLRVVSRRHVRHQGDDASWRPKRPWSARPDTRRCSFSEWPGAIWADGCEHVRLRRGSAAPGIASRSPRPCSRSGYMPASAQATTSGRRDVRLTLPLAAWRPAPSDRSGGARELFELVDTDDPGSVAAGRLRIDT